MGRLAWKIGNGAGSRSLKLSEETNMISFIVTILVGALCGWLASIIMKTNAQQGAFLNIIIGIVGSIIAQFVFVNLLHIGGAAAAGDGFHFTSILWGVIGSVILIVILKGLRVLR
jgi:uncharacterized membrane protein YeaQ/YmgE (transglycosylase-associated protein family)